MKTKAFLVAMASILLVYAPVMAGNFRAGKIPESGSDSEFRTFFKAQSSQASGTISNERSGDPCGLLPKWGLVLDVWKNGNAEHNLSPTKTIVCATEENDGNVVVTFIKMELAQQLITLGQKWNNDFEYRLLEAMGYGANQSDRYRWYGFVPNLVGETYQNALEESRGLTFKEAFMKSTDGQGDWDRFQELYSVCAQFMNDNLGLNTTYSPWPSSSGYYHDFAVTPLNREKYIEAVQLLFEVVGSPLADKDLFKKSGIPSIINYDTPEKFCQCQ